MRATAFTRLCLVAGMLLRCAKGVSVVELLVLLGALAVVFGACCLALRLLAYEFDSEVGPCENGRDRARRLRSDLVEL